MAVNKDVLEALRKRAFGFWADDVLEEFELEENLKSRKEKTKFEDEKKGGKNPLGDNVVQYKMDI